MAELNLLVVDDNEIEFQIIKRLFSKDIAKRYTLTWEPTWEGALERMANNEFDAYLVDYRLGAKDGIELVVGAKRKGCVGATIILTGYENPQLDSYALGSGADDYLQKNDLNFFFLEKAVRHAVERKKVERNITNQQIRFSQSMKMMAMGEMASEIAHEVNNPLTVLFATVSFLRNELLKKDYIDESISKRLDTLEDMTGRISKIIKTLRRVHCEDEKMTFQKVSFESIMNSTLDLCQHKLSSEGVKFEVNIENNDFELECSPNEISQILVNLINNSVDALSDIPEKWIKLRAKLKDDLVIIALADSGAGIPKNIAENIFSPFYSKKKSKKSTGLGLNICRKIMEFHAGNIFVNHDSSNTEFILELPKSQSIRQKKEELKVLIVDDEPDINLLVKNEFLLKGHQVFTALDGLQGLEIYKKEAMDVMVVDINMPGLNGINFVKKALDERRGDEPMVVFITAYDDRITSSDESLAHYKVFQKPFNVIELVRYCQEHFLSRRQKELEQEKVS